MGTLYLVRHAQASLGAADYDQLSALGQQQAARLGQYWAERGVQMDAVLTGTLRRHAQTWQALAQAAGWQHMPVCLPGLDEYDSGAVIRAARPQQPMQPPRPPERQAPQLQTPELQTPKQQPPVQQPPEQPALVHAATLEATDHRAHFRTLRQGLALWMAGETTPLGMPAWSDFQRGVVSALDQVRTTQTGRQVLIVSSGGPIATALGHVLGLDAPALIELNMRIRNSSVSECVFNPKRFSLLTYNTLPHLDLPEHRDWVTYA